MIVTFLRSSSYNCLDECEHKYYLQYVLGFESKANKKAAKGSVVHKVLECLANANFHTKKGVASFQDDALGEIFASDCNDLYKLTEKSYRFYEKHEPHDWNDDDLEDCFKWVNKTLDFNDGMFDPRVLDIVCPEQKFDFTIEEDWAKYHYELPDGTHLEGYLGLKGTIDLIVKNDDSYEIIDWKTGKRVNWNTGKEKTLDCLQKDPQLLMYFYAAKKLYPDVDHIAVTIFYVNDGGPYTVVFDNDSYAEAENLIRKRFYEIRNITRPKLNINWKCRWCSFGPSSLGQFHKSKTLCELINIELNKNGMRNTNLKYGDMSKINSYRDGGGRHDSK